MLKETLGMMRRASFALKSGWKRQNSLSERLETVEKHKFNSKCTEKRGEMQNSLQKALRKLKLVSKFVGKRQNLLLRGLETNRKQTFTSKCTKNREKG